MQRAGHKNEVVPKQPKKEKENGGRPESSS
jgi:hypothetical protein